MSDLKSQSILVKATPGLTSTRMQITFKPRPSKSHSFRCQKSTHISGYKLSLSLFAKLSDITHQKWFVKRRGKKKESLDLKLSEPESIHMIG